jgi:hypothetical protein
VNIAEQRRHANHTAARRNAARISRSFLRKGHGTAWKLLRLRGKGPLWSAVLRFFPSEGASLLGRL